MSARYVLSMIVTILAMPCTAGAQVVMDMPPPPRAGTSTLTTTIAPSDSVAGVDVGDVALYRYGSTRFTPRSMTPRYYRRPYFYDFYTPYAFYGFAGSRCFLPPVKFHTKHPFSKKNFGFGLH